MCDLAFIMARLCKEKISETLSSHMFFLISPAISSIFRQIKNTFYNVPVMSSMTPEDDRSSLERRRVRVDE